LQHLNNRNNYSLDAPTALQHQRIIDTTRNAYRDLMNVYFFNPRQKKYIKSWPVDQFKVPKFHILPKLHKEGPLKGRPIAGAINWFTTPISTILDIELKPVLLDMPHILKNSNQLIQEIEILNSQEMPQQYYIITGDINSLYPSIDQARLTNLFGHLGGNRYIHLTHLVRFLLEHAYVSYDGKIFRQRNGIPMGTNAATSLANIYCGDLDEYLSSRRSTFHYRRFIDDFFILWTGTLEEWTVVSNFSQFIIPGITIAWEVASRYRQVFLDIDIQRDPFSTKLTCSPYQKPLNKYLYISPKSSHDRHTFAGFIKGELTRYARLSTSPHNYQITKELFYKRLLKRGYPRYFLYPIFNKHRWITRDYQDPLIQSKILPFILPFTYRNNQQDLKNIIYHYGNLLATDMNPWTKPLFVYSKSKSLGSYLVRSSITRAHSIYLRDHPNERPWEL
jgi:hypothetical protein